MKECPNENDLLARVSRSLPRERAEQIDAHVDHCAECRMLLAEAAHWLEEPRGRVPSATTFTSGDVVAERYLIVRLLGAGGMGEVYEASDRLLGEEIALKTLLPVIADDEGALERLHAEVRMARRVTHQNVCRVYDLGFHHRAGERIAFITMELVRGTSLRQYLRDVTKLELSTALPLLGQMVAALRHAHAAGVVHRDFKSDNVLLVPGSDGSQARVVVTDFGLARQSNLVGETQRLTPRSRTVLGTLDYMSPEQVMGKPATPASDIYALGIVIYEMLTGELPFRGDSPLARAVLRVTQRAPRLERCYQGSQLARARASRAAWRRIPHAVSRRRTTSWRRSSAKVGRSDAPAWSPARELLWACCCSSWQLPLFSSPVHAEPIAFVATVGSGTRPLVERDRAGGDATNHG